MVQAKSDPPSASGAASRRSIVAVIIPFYQRQSGVLARALASIAEQTIDLSLLHVIIVDDASPAGPEIDIEQASLPDGLAVTTIARENGGPAAARNTGLAFAEKLGVRYVAFLDSDDWWEPGHLATAIACLRDGTSFYFCDNMRYGLAGQNELVSFKQTWPLRAQTPGIERVEGVDDAFQVPAGSAFNAFLEAYLSQTSSVVFDLERHADARFDEALRGAGEDHLLWMKMARSSTGVSFSDQCNVSCGLGVNLYFSAIDWAVPATRERFGYLALLYVRIIETFDLNKAQRELASTRRRNALAMYGYLTLRNLARGRLPARQLLARLFAGAPMSTVLLPLWALRLAALPSEKRVAFAEQVR